MPSSRRRTGNAREEGGRWTAERGARAYRRDTAMTANIVSAAEAADLIRSAGALVFESGIVLPPARFDGDYNPLSGREEWAKAHIPGSRHVDLLRRWVDPSEHRYHFAAPDPAVLAVQLGEDGVDGSRPVLVYDTDGGIWAARLWWTLRNAGIQSAVIDGGLDGWIAAGLPVESGEPGSVPAVPSPPVRDRGLWVGLPEVERISRGDERGQLICALSKAQFDGTEPTRYGRRGHIPGSVNVVARGFVGDDGSFVGPDGRRAVLGRLPEVASQTDPLVLYCGGGISACLAALGLTEAGYRDLRVYDGSIEEWAARDDLPLVVDAVEG